MKQIIIKTDDCCSHASRSYSLKQQLKLDSMFEGVEIKRDLINGSSNIQIIIDGDLFFDERVWMEKNTTIRKAFGNEVVMYPKYKLPAELVKLIKNTMEDDGKE